jgi:hypothetical protein
MNFLQFGMSALADMGVPADQSIRSIPSGIQPDT